MRTCLICEKGSQMSGGYSNRVRATKYNPIPKLRKQPNLQWATLPANADGTRAGRIKICTACIRGGKHLKVTLVK